MDNFTTLTQSEMIETDGGIYTPQVILTIDVLWWADRREFSF